MDNSGCDFTIYGALFTNSDIASFDVSIQTAINLDVAIGFDVACNDKVAAED